MTTPAVDEKRVGGVLAKYFNNLLAKEAIGFSFVPFLVPRATAEGGVEFDNVRRTLRGKERRSTIAELTLNKAEVTFLREKGCISAAPEVTVSKARALAAGVVKPSPSCRAYGNVVGC